MFDITATANLAVKSVQRRIRSQQFVGSDADILGLKVYGFPMPAYYLEGIAPRYIDLVQAFKGCTPFLAMVFLSMALLYIFSSIAFWLPSQIYGR